MENSECKCQKLFDFVPQTEDPDCVSLENYKTVFLDFGETEILRKKWLSYQLENDYTKENTFTITRDPETNPIYQVFGFHTYKIKVPPHSNTTAKIFYCPTFPNTASVDHFNIVDTLNNTTRIRVTGKGLAPCIQVSTNFLKFFTWDERKSCRHTVELRNFSSVDAKYSLDMNKESVPFNCEQVLGTIPANGYIYVHITFSPEEYGLFSQQFECLVLHHDPIIIKLLGVHTKENKVKNTELIFYSENVLSNNFMSYMADVQTCVKEFPLFSLSESYLDFGGVPFTNDSSQDLKTLVTSFTNHSNNAISIEWNNDDVFKVSPKRLNIPPDESALLECIFSPNKPDFIFSKTITGNVYWSSRKCQFLEGSITVPLPVSIKTLGHSFFYNSYWIPQLELVPEVVILPPTIPTFTIFTTFYLKTEGYLPVSFKFLPPKKTNFLIKPMIGVVEGYKIIVAQLQTEAHRHSKAYIEQWGIQLNGQTTHMIPFYIKGFSQEILAVVGQNNRLTFKGIQTGCIQKLVIPVKNFTQHILKYELQCSEEIEITETTGEIGPNSKIFLHAHYKSDCDSSKKLALKFCFYKIDQLQVLGQPYELSAEIFLESIFSELCCTPSNFELGDVECHTKHTTTFNLFNFGTSTIHFILSAKNKDGTINEKMNITPFKDSLKPEESMEITLFYAIETSGEHIVEIFYSIRLSEDSGSILPDYQKCIFTFTCNALYPYIEIIDIAHDNFGPLFSKAVLWDFLNIDKLNYTMSKIKKGQIVNVMLSVPDCEESMEKYYSVFIMRNMTAYPLTIRLKRRKLCSCELEELEEFISLRRKHYNCPHRNIFKLSVGEEVVQARSIQSIRMEVVYSILGTTDMSYEMILSHKRKIILNFRIKTLVALPATISTYAVDFDLKLNDVCLSEIDPYNQCFWLYNNSISSIDFALDITTLLKINEINNFNIISCVNPYGTIQAYSAIPILFKFIPIEYRKIYISLPMTIGDDQTNLIIAAQGTATIPPRKKHSIPSAQMLNVDAPILVSECHLIVNAFPTWSVTYKLIFIKNMTKSRVIGYSWQSYCIQDMVEITVPDRKGVLQPKQSASVVIQIRSFGTPFETRLQLPCKLLDHTEYFEHKRSLAAYNARQEEIEGQFVITEEGIFYPENNVVIQPFPKQFYLTISMEVIVSSVSDRDKYYTTLQQLQHCSSSYLLDDSIGEREKEENINENIPEKEHESENNIRESAEISFLAGVMECIIADGVFSKLFKKSLGYETPLYYSQIREKEDNQHQELIKDMYSDPQGPVVVDVLKEAITDSLHQVFQLGSRNSYGHMVAEVGFDTRNIESICSCKE